MKAPSAFSPRTQWTTRYPVDLIKAVLQVKGAAYLCDEIARDEDPAYVQSDLLASLFSYATRAEFDGKRLLDFGCGAGASTMVIARMLPGCRIFGVELQERLLGLARLRAEHYGLDNLTLLHSPAPDRLPQEIPKVDFVVLCAVYEHLLPNERPALLLQLWERLARGGILFLNQTPDRRFPIETHTTGLPLINYLPGPIALLCARRFSRREVHADSWESLLRKGIRGATPSEVLRILSRSTSSPVFLRPRANEIRRQSDIWYQSARKRLRQRYSGPQQKALLALMSLAMLSRVPVAPYISLGVRKGMGSGLLQGPG